MTQVFTKRRWISSSCSFSNLTHGELDRKIEKGIRTQTSSTLNIIKHTHWAEHRYQHLLKARHFLNWTQQNLLKRLYACINMTQNIWINRNIYSLYYMVWLISDYSHWTLDMYAIYQDHDYISWISCKKRYIHRTWITKYWSLKNGNCDFQRIGKGPDFEKK